MFEQNSQLLLTDGEYLDVIRNKNIITSALWFYLLRI